MKGLTEQQARKLQESRIKRRACELIDPHLQLRAQARYLREQAGRLRREGSSADIPAAEEQEEQARLLEDAAIPERPFTRLGATEKVLMACFQLWYDNGGYGPRSTQLGEDIYQAYKATRDRRADAAYEVYDVMEGVGAQVGCGTPYILLWTAFQALKGWEREPAPDDPMQ